MSTATRRPFDIFVVGLDDGHLAHLRALPGASSYRFHALFARDELRHAERFPVRRILREGPQRLRAFPGRVDAVVGYLDFPVSTTLPLLRRAVGLPTTTLESVLACEHKFWSRLEQADVIGEHVPRFCAVDPFERHAEASIELEFPFWIKPVKSALSHLGFLVHDTGELRRAIHRLRAGIGRFGTPFNEVLRHAHLPERVAGVDGHHCIAESVISQGRQCTVEGYVHGGDVVIYGTVDSHREGPARSSFGRYQYPSTLPQSVRGKMADVASRFIRHIGYENAPFNIEFFWNEATDQVWLLEINPRISQSHAPLFRAVDGVEHYQVMLDLALGRRPSFPHRRGRYACAAKFMLRSYGDACVAAAPDADAVRQLEREEDAQIELHVRPGLRLSELRDQDSYSYEVAALFIGAHDEDDLERRYRRCRDRLGLRLTPVTDRLQFHDAHRSESAPPRRDH